MLVAPGGPADKFRLSRSDAAKKKVASVDILDAPPDLSSKWSGERELGSDDPPIGPRRIAIVKITISYGADN